MIEIVVTNETINPKYAKKLVKWAGKFNGKVSIVIRDCTLTDFYLAKDFDRELLKQLLDNAKPSKGVSK